MIVLLYCDYISSDQLTMVNIALGIRFTVHITLDVIFTVVIILDISNLLLLIIHFILHI